jgi:predicted phosphate transport protein (TIGR00153 family)
LSLGQRVVSLFGSTPRYDEVYDLLRRAGENTQYVTALLDELMRAWPDVPPERRTEIVDLEHEGDRITHDLIRHLYRKANTPLDAHATHRLASQIDDVVDLSEEVADFLWLYRVEAPTDHAIELTGILRAAGAEVGVALSKLGDPESLQPHLAEIDRLEHEGDRVEREALVTLFEGGIDPMVVIRWKDIYERLEAAIDASDRVAMSLREVSTGTV